jgi:hypothetical protein
MRPPYIFLVGFFFATLLGASGCSLIDEFKKPNTLSNKVGNFSPNRLDTDKSERRAAKNVTPLLKGSRDLDGKEEKFDPAFGSPETESELAQERAEMKSSRAAAAPGVVGGAQRGGDRVHSSAGSGQSFDDGQSQYRGQASVGGSPALVESTGSSNSALLAETSPTNFAPESHSSTPISGMPPSAATGSSQGFGCPPSGTAGLGSFGRAQNSSVGMNPGVMTPSSVPQGLTAPTQMSPSSTPEVSVASPSSISRLGVSSSATPLAISPAPQSPSLTNAPTAFGNPTNQPGANAFPNASAPTSGGAPAQRNSLGHIPRRLRSVHELPFANPLSKPVVAKKSWWPFDWFGGKPEGDANDASLVDAQNQHAKNVNVTATARVHRLLPDDRQGSPHQRFLLRTSTGSTVLVAHNISLAQYIPLKEGDYVTVSGEFIWNEKGGVLHYTHHATNSRHRGGYIEYNRQKYQ